MLDGRIHDDILKETEQIKISKLKASKEYTDEMFDEMASDTFINWLEHLKEQEEG